MSAKTEKNSCFSRADSTTYERFAKESPRTEVRRGPRTEGRNRIRTLRTKENHPENRRENVRRSNCLGWDEILAGFIRTKREIKMKMSDVQKAYTVQASDCEPRMK